MKKILLYLIVILTPFIFISKANATVTLNGKTLKRNQVVYNYGSNVTLGITSAPVTLSFGQRDHILYGVIMLCTNNTSLMNAASDNISVQYTDIACTLPPNTDYEWPDNYPQDNPQEYDGNVVYLLVNWNTTNDIPDNGNYYTKSYTANFTIENSPWHPYALINDMYSFDPIDFDLSSKTLIEQNKEIIEQNKETIEKLEEQNQKVQQQIQEQEKTNDALTSDSDDESSSSCGMICKLKNILSYINPLSEKFFAYKLVELLIDALKSLIVPDDMSFVTDFVDALESKLGFIGAIPGQIIEFAINLVSASWSEFNSISFPSISIFGYNFWDSQEIDLTEAINIFKPFKYVTDCICVVLCARTLNKWREQFTGGSSE